MSTIETPKPPQTLIEKLAAVMAQVERVPKNGWNDFHKYHYATEADLSDAVRSSMARFGVMLYPSVEKVEWTQIQAKNGTERLATLTVKFTATDGKDKIEFTVLGEGQDRGDKATYKAMTGATKYALLKLFLIPTGDDPETEDGEQPHKGSRKEPQPQTAKHAEPEKHGPSPAAVALWTKVVESQGGNKTLAKGLWENAAKTAKAPASSAEWTPAHVKAVSEALFPADVAY